MTPHTQSFLTILLSISLQSPPPKYFTFSQISSPIFMRNYEQGQGQYQGRRPLQGQGQGNKPILPKFGEWNVNDPASADGYTVIFTKARDEKKAKTTIGHSPPPPPPPPKAMPQARTRNHPYDHNKKKWLCCF